MGTVMSFHHLLLFVLFFIHGFTTMAQTSTSMEGSQRWFGGDRQECRLERLNALEPTRRVESEGGFTEYFDENNNQFRCAGVAAHRRTINSRGLLLLAYSNAPRLIYFMQGQLICGTVLPGCPATFQSFQERGESEQRESREEEKHGSNSRDQHQKLHHLRQGDIFAVPAGIPYWCYNDAESPAVTITVMDTSSNTNQLDPNRREFLLAGSQKSGQQQQQEKSSGSSQNIFKGFGTQILAQSLGVSTEIAQKLQQSPPDHIVQLKKPLQMVRPQEGQRREEEEEERQEKEERSSNGLEQAFCTLRFRENIDNPQRADVYNPRGGRLTALNSLKLPILNVIQMTAIKGVLHKGASLVPNWNINAHTVVYATRGSANLQIVDDRGNRVFDGELRQHQLLVVPQYFVMLMRAKSDRFEWVSFKTNANAIQNQIPANFGAMPIDVIANSYPGISREQARMLKSNTQDKLAIIAPSSQHEQQGRDQA